MEPDQLARVSWVLGVPVDDVTLQEAEDRIIELVRYGRRTGRTHQIATVNLDFLVRSSSDATLRVVLQHCDLSVPDGMPVLWGASALGSSLRVRVAGSDLVPLLAERCAREGLSLYLYGAAEGVAAEAARILRERHPGLEVHGAAAPMVSADGEVRDMTVEEVAAPIRALRPDIVCVALGHPKQERWIERHRDAIGAPAFIGVGASVDFIVGRVSRAPEWMQKTGLEWLYRLLQEPKRLAGRYAGEAVRVGPLLARQRNHVRRASRVPVTVDVAGEGGRTVLRPSGPFRIADLPAELQDRLSEGTALHVDLSALGRLDQPTADALATLARHARLTGGSIEVTVPPALLTTLHGMHLTTLFDATATAVTGGQAGDERAPAGTVTMRPNRARAAAARPAATVAPAPAPAPASAQAPADGDGPAVAVEQPTGVAAS